MCAKHIWETTKVSYKAALNEWYKGTGDGLGLDTEFEIWNDEKFEKYGVDLEEYDHSDISSRPLILFNLYAKKENHILLS